MAPIRVMVIDDEPLALERLANLLDQIPAAQLVATLQSGGDAVQAISELLPDLLLIDVEMPRTDGFDVIDALWERCRSAEWAPPLICFVTAFPQFAAHAFETGAIDYLCKPVRLARLQKTISRAQTLVTQRNAVRRLDDLSSQLEELRRTQGPGDVRHLWLQQRGETIRLEVSAIDWLKAEGECVRLHFGDQSYLHRSSISSMCTELFADGFVRIHRSAVINQARLKAVRRKRSGCTVLLDSGIELPVGRRYRHAIQELGSIPSEQSLLTTI